VDFVTGVLFGAWLFHLAYPADVRRIFIGLLIGCFLFSARARRELLFARLGRGAFCALVRHLKLRKTAAFAFGGLLILRGTLKALALEYPLFDVGIFHQLLWNLSQGKGFLSSISGAEQFLRDHLVLSLSVFAPLYRVASLNSWVLGAAPGFLAGALLALVFWAWWFLAERIPLAAVGTSRRRAWVSSALICAAFGFQTFYGNLHWGLHENFAGAAFLSWALAIYFAFSSEQRSRIAFAASYLLLILAAGSKESYLLVIAFTALGLVLCEKKAVRKLSFAALAVGCLAAFVWYAQSDRDPGKNYFTRYYGYLGADLRSMIGALVFHPIRSFLQMPLKQDLRYLRDIVFPLGMIPLGVAILRPVQNKYPQKWGNWAIALGLLPPIGSGLLSTHDTLRDPGLHYFFEFVPILGVLMVLAFFSLRSRQQLPRWSLALIVVSGFTFWSEPWREVIPSARGAFQSIPLIEKLNRIPTDAVVMTQNGAGPWLASRRKASDWGDLKALGGLCPDYFVVEVDPAKSIEKVQKYADIEQVLRICHQTEGRAKKAEMIDGSGHWWIYRTQSDQR
jgi:hypothetical protein